MFTETLQWIRRRFSTPRTSPRSTVEALERAGEAHRRAVATLRESNAATEARLRTLAWAFAGRRAGALRFARTLRSHRPQLVWWLSDRPVPPALARRAGSDVIVLADARTAEVAPRRGAIFLTDNPALVECAGRRFELSGVAALVQALFQYGAEPWIPVAPPRGFRGLRTDVRLSTMRTRSALGYAGAIQRGALRDEIVVPRSALDDLIPSPSMQSRAAFAARLSGRSPMADDKMVPGKPMIDFPTEPGESAPELSVPHVLILTALDELDEPRSEEELEAAFREEITASSLSELLQQKRTEISGTVEGPDGEPVHVSCEVKGVDTFSESGLTLAIPELYQWYVRARVYEQLRNRKLAALDTEELADLELQIEALEQKLAAVASSELGGVQ